MRYMIVAMATRLSLSDAVNHWMGGGGNLQEVHSWIRTDTSARR